MKRTAILIAILFALTSTFAFANRARTPSSVDGPKTHTPSGTPVGGAVGGDDVGSATAIGSLPYFDSDNSCTYVNDYDEVCPYSGGTAPDAVYSFSPGVDMGIRIDLCNSWYDTKVYVYEDQAGNLVACNDDECSGPNYPYTYLSYLDCVQLTAGHTYFIVVDGYGTDCGVYELNVSECYPPVPCEVVCPDGATIEGEPLCGPGYLDPFNGGCNSTPPVFTYLQCDGDPLYFCGESGTWYDPYSGYYSRDTDWLSFTLTETKTVKLTTCAEFEVQTLLVIPQPDCSYYTYPYIQTAEAFWPAIIEVTLGPGEYWYWVGCADFYAGVPCGARYVSTIEGWCPPSGTKSSSWGGIKNIFR